MNDWSALYLTEETGASGRLAPLGSAVVSVMMVLARLLGDGWRGRWGDARMVRVGSTAARRRSRPRPADRRHLARADRLRLRRPGHGDGDGPVSTSPPQRRVRAPSPWSPPGTTGLLRAGVIGFVAGPHGPDDRHAVGAASAVLVACAVAGPLRERRLPWRRRPTAAAGGPG
ncbi:hypothetical protein GCM10023238_06750 [Streptomyces heliomycini]